MVRIPDRLMPHTVTVEPLAGDATYGTEYGSPVSYPHVNWTGSTSSKSSLTTDTDDVVGVLRTHLDVVLPLGSRVSGARVAGTAVITAVETYDDPASPQHHRYTCT